MDRNNQKNKKVIVRNSLALYFRSALSMAITLYTSRVILQILGIVDFGIYNIIAGIVGMFTVFTGTISNAVSRFFAFAMGKSDATEITRIYTVCINIVVLALLVVVLLGETIGVYFLNTKLNVPVARMVAANWVYQAVLISFVINSLNIANNAAIIANEKMTFFAYMGIFDVVTKLVIVLLLGYFDVDKLKLYASLLCIQQVCLFACYQTYVSHHFSSCLYRLKIYRETFRQLVSYIGWTFLSSLAFVTKNQGVDIVLNLFFGPTVNAAKGIAAQVQNATSTFGVNFLTAISPQITKNYASGDFKHTLDYVFKGMRLSVYLLMLLMLPIAFNIDFILHLWLVKVPPMTATFVILILVVCALDTCSLPFHYGITASGNIKYYQIGSAVIQWCNLPLAYICLRLGMPPYSVLLVAIVCTMVLFAMRVLTLRRDIFFSLISFAKVFVFNLLVVVLVAVFCDKLLLGESIDLLGLIKSVVVITIINVLVIYLLGFNKHERSLINSKLNSYVSKISK